jgi:uridine kinase
MIWKLAAAVSLRLVLIIIVVPSYLSTYFAPFLSQLSLTFDNWGSWLTLGGDSQSFPYGIAMLIVYLPSLLISNLLEAFSLGPMRSLEIAVGLQTLLFEVLFWKHLAKTPTMKKSLSIFLFSPLIIWVNYFLGLNDFFPSACLFFAAYLLIGHKYRAAGFLIGLAIGMKFSLALVLPFLLVFAWDNPRFKKNIWMTALTSFIVGGFMYFPVLYSEGFREMVFNNKESMKALGYYLNLGGSQILVLPIIYVLLLYWIWKAGRISVEVLIAFFGIALFLISAFSPASIGWMLWGLPLMFMNLAKERKSRIQLVLIQILFLLHSISTGVTINLLGTNVNTPETDDQIRNIIFTFGLSLIAIWSFSNLKTAIRLGDQYKIATAPLTISIAGDSGTGKDTLTRALTDMFTPETSITICGDDYHKFERGDESWKQVTHLNPTANYLDLWARDYNLAYNRRYFEQREYDHNSGKFSQLKPRLRRDLLISQGLHALFPQLTSNSDLKIYLSMSDELRIKLKLERDQKSRGQTYEMISETMKRRKEDFHLYVAPQKEISDLHFHLYEERGELQLEIGTSTNRVIDSFFKEIASITSNPVMEKIEPGRKVYTVNSDHYQTSVLKKILNDKLTAYDQLFLEEPVIPEGTLGVMSVLTIILVATSREEYSA